MTYSAPKWALCYCTDRQHTAPADREEWRTDRAAVENDVLYADALMSRVHLLRCIEEIQVLPISDQKVAEYRDAVVEMQRAAAKSEAVIQSIAVVLDAAGVSGVTTHAGEEGPRPGESISHFIARRLVERGVHLATSAEAAA